MTISCYPTHITHIINTESVIYIEPIVQRDDIANIASVSFSENRNLKRLLSMHGNGIHFNLFSMDYIYVHIFRCID